MGLDSFVHRLLHRRPVRECFTCVYLTRWWRQVIHVYVVNIVMVVLYMWPHLCLSKFDFRLNFTLYHFVENLDLIVGGAPVLIVDKRIARRKHTQWHSCGRSRMILYQHHHLHHRLRRGVRTICHLEHEIFNVIWEIWVFLPSIDMWRTRVICCWLNQIVILSVCISAFLLN